jgi:Protein of unknown function (DUF1203)
MSSLAFSALSPTLIDHARAAALAGGAVAEVADQSPFPVRCCLTDASADEGVLLLSVKPPCADSPYTAASPVYIHSERCAGYRADGAVPEILCSRLLSLRGYDHGHMITGTEVVQGDQLEAAAERLLATAGTAYLFVHFAGPGCYACRIEAAA